MPATNYKEVSAIARKRRAANISAHYQVPHTDVASLPNNLTDYALKSGYYDAHELEIIQSEAPAILQNIKTRKWTALEVAKAFCKASAFAQELTNCLTEVLYPEAMERAQYLDDYLARTGKPLGPLHGLPISLKDSFITSPHPSSIGMSAYANEATTKDSVMVNILRGLGAVFYCKTNVPTAMMMAETNNNVWGECINPLHKKLSPGGSSGGEGALIAFKASPLGIGTDIGGSVRIPAAWCHQYGLKPSFGRFPVTGGKPSIPGQEFILAVNGPMSRSLEALKLYCAAVLSSEVAPWQFDHKSLPIPWRLNVIQPPGRKLRIGFIGPHDGLVHVQPPVQRALDTTQKTLEEAGHEIIPWPYELHEIIVKNLVASFFDLGGTAITEMLTPFEEPVFPAMQGYTVAAKAELNVTQMRYKVMQRNELQQKYLEAWNATATSDKGPMDCIIMAVAPWAAPRLGATQKAMYVGYTGVCNFLDFCACTFPVTFADKDIDVARDSKSFHQLSEIDGRIQADYDAEFYHGAPVSLQLAGRRLEEEKVLEMVEIVADVLKHAGVK
ncbi:hypothetical protein LTR70_008621 [Exophiala xenobiotica]|uniref:amidase n=1 Tax=Lithohypha guttulata TaxID=1690604 RepID=A0ABR0K180_9EURO|nr:hypothetical protein LTR24_008020 [Lithohypha guttulata]KAK5311699.1 hypothetical protein LTR70_008621 [Exophiala xenobiotica]